LLPESFARQKITPIGGTIDKIIAEAKDLIKKDVSLKLAALKQ
jgi:hypothetical protein